MSKSVLKGEVATDLQKFANAAIGAYGIEMVSDTEMHHAGDGQVFVAIQFIDDSTLDTLTIEPGFSLTGNAIAGETYTAGTVIYGRFTAIMILSGRLIAYKGV
jgi:hypothetical protein